MVLTRISAGPDAHAALMKHRILNTWNCVRNERVDPGVRIELSTTLKGYDCQLDFLDGHTEVLFGDGTRVNLQTFDLYRRFSHVGG